MIGTAFGANAIGCLGNLNTVEATTTSLRAVCVQECVR